MSTKTQEKLQQQFVNESAQLALEKYNLESRLKDIKKRLMELSVASNVLNVSINSTKQEESASGETED